MNIKFVLILASLMLVMGIQSLAIGAEKDLVGLWAFDEGTGNKVKDLSGNGNDGTISGAKWVDGKFAKALEFNGDGDQVLVPHADVLNIEGELTIEAWVFPTGWNPDLNAIAQKWEDGSNRRQYQLTVYGATKTNWWYVSNAGSNWPRAEGKVVVELNKWTHLAGTYDGKKLRSYTNGTLDVELDQPNGIFASDIPVAIGGYGPNTKEVTYGQNRHFTGIIDEVRFWSRALSEKEIKDGMNSTAAPVEPKGKLTTTWGSLKSDF